MITDRKLIFRILWLGQSVSLLGTGMTRFAIMIWAFEQTGTATSLALLGFFSCLTFILASPFTGVLVDHLDRKRLLIISDLGSGLMTLLLLVLHASGHLQIFHLYLAEGIVGICEALQYPAFDASLGLLLPAQEFTRANALLGLGRSLSRIFAPVFAGLLLPVAGLNAVMAVDLSTLALAMLGLTIVRLPGPPVHQSSEVAVGSFWKELSFGAAYIFHRPALRALVISFFLVNLFGTLTYFAVLSPMILARSGNDETALGIVRMLMGVGGVLGGFLVSLWGGTRNRVRMYLFALTLSFLVGDFLTAVSRSTLGWSIAGFFAEMSIPFIVSPYYALWLEAVPSAVQGRVFSTREMVQVASQPIGYLLGGLLADQVFEPAMAGSLANALGWLVGTGPGSGMSVMFLCTCVCGALVGVLAFFSPSLRQLEDPVACSPGHTISGQN